jgi:hypothetical protein
MALENMSAPIQLQPQLTPLLPSTYRGALMCRCKTTRRPCRLPRKVDPRVKKWCYFYDVPPKKSVGYSHTFFSVFYVVYHAARFISLSYTIVSPRGNLVNHLILISPKSLENYKGKLLHIHTLYLNILS